MQERASHRNMQCKISVAVFFATTGYVLSFNILAIFPYPGMSHFHVFRVYLQELARRGHNLTVVSHFPENEPAQNYHDIQLAAAKTLLGGGIIDFPFFNKHLTVIYKGILVMNSGIHGCKILLANKQVQELIAKKQKFDLVVVEHFNSGCPLGVAYKLQAPVIGVTSHVIMPWQYSRYGIPYNPSFTPYHYSNSGTKPTHFQRVEATIFMTYLKVLYYYLGQKSDEQTLSQYFDDIPPLESLARDIKFLLLYHNFLLTGSRLFPPNVIEVGGYHITKTKPLPEDIQKYMDDAEDGVIYISFGTIVKKSTLTAHNLEVILEAMEYLPQRFIWKWDHDISRMDKNKLYVSSWLPQNDILGHEKTLAFFSHAGMAGSNEAIHHGVPMLLMPLFADQPANAAAIEECGLGVQMQIENLTKDNIIATFKSILDPKFREHVKQLSRAWHDRPVTPLDTAVHWTEFTARYPNFTFRAPSADVPIYQYYNIDVILVFILTIVLIVFVIKIVKTILNIKNKSVHKILKLN